MGLINKLQKTKQKQNKTKKPEVSKKSANFNRKLLYKFKAYFKTNLAPTTKPI